jgi:hypothetical protein
MSHDEITTIITRLDRMERKLDELGTRYERHEAQAEQQDRYAGADISSDPRGTALWPQMENRVLSVSELRE